MTSQVEDCATCGEAIPRRHMSVDARHAEIQDLPVPRLDALSGANSMPLHYLSRQTAVLTADTCFRFPRPVGREQLCRPQRKVHTSRT